MHTPSPSALGIVGTGPLCRVLIVGSVCWTGCLDAPYLCVVLDDSELRGCCCGEPLFGGLSKESARPDAVTAFDWLLVDFQAPDLASVLTFLFLVLYLSSAILLESNTRTNTIIGRAIAAPKKRCPAAVNMP